VSMLVDLICKYDPTLSTYVESVYYSRGLVS